MKRYFCITGLISLILLISISGIQAKESARVKWIVDGDTLILTSGKTVRYIGINAPEVGFSGKESEFFGREAREFHANLLDKHKIFLEYGPEKWDRYGRLLAYVYTQDGRFSNRILLKHGMAYCLYRSPNTKYFNVLLSSQRDAMQQKLGMWSNLDRVAKPLVGNKRSYRFHKTDCDFGSKTRKSNQIGLQGYWDAFWRGYAPCKRCFPTGVFSQK